MHNMGLCFQIAVTSAQTVQFFDDQKAKCTILKADFNLSCASRLKGLSTYTVFSENFCNLKFVLYCHSIVCMFYQSSASISTQHFNFCIPVLFYLVHVYIQFFWLIKNHAPHSYLLASVSSHKFINLIIIFSTNCIFFSLHVSILEEKYLKKNPMSKTGKAKVCQVNFLDLPTHVNFIKY